MSTRSRRIAFLALLAAGGIVYNQSGRTPVPEVVRKAGTVPEAIMESAPAGQGSGGKAEAGQSAAVGNSVTVGISRVEDSAAILGFNDWTARWLAADEAGRESMREEGRQRAVTRRPAMQRLIKANPQLALEMAVRPVVRQDLPVEVVEQLEKPVSARGDYKAYFGRPREGAVLPPDQELVMRYFETPEGDSYKANVYGGMQEVTSRKNVALRGVAIGREMAVSESPVRQLEKGERIAAGTPVNETCPVSNITTETSTAETLTVEDDTPVVELAGRLIRLCDGSHVRIFDEQQRMASGGPGVAGNFLDNYPGTSSEAIGNFRCLYIRVTYPDQMRAPNSEGRGWDDMRNVSRYYLESSFGRMTTTASVTPLVIMPHTKAWYIAKDSEVDGLGLVHSDARAEARKLGYDSNQYNCTIVRVNEGPRLSGISWGGGDSVWVSWDGMDVLNHECGHSLGRNHANFWATTDGSAIGVGANQEYGNSFDVMGGGGGFGAHYNSYSKRSLGWLPDTGVHRPSTSPSANGVYRLYAYDQPSLEEGKRYSLRVDKDPQRRFYLEYHPGIGGEWTDSVLMILSGLGSNCGHLVDTTPGSSGGKGDGGIRVGRTFSDFESDMHFTVLSKNATTPPSMDLAMMRGPFPGNLPPVISSLNASATSIAVNGSATFTVTATDPNNDALAYHWEFSDRYVTTNTPSITRSFANVEMQNVGVTVSDMKGGTARAYLIVSVGSPGRGTVSGRITAGGQPLAGVYVVGKSSGHTDRYAYTDSNGNYSVCQLNSAAYTFTATLTGYTFTEGFANPVNVTPVIVTGKDWTAASVPEVTLTATNAAEGGAAGSFVLTRTGDTSADLVVTVAPVTGLATKGTDYTLSPDYAASGSLETLTIPAGSASLTVAVAATDDSAQEGPEWVQLQLAAGPYQVRKGGSAVLTIADNDTTRPVVSIAATDFYATETPGDTGTFVISRTGDPSAPLNVTLAYSGTATRGTDYPALATTFTIPAGQSSAPLSLVPIDDAGIEVPEDATVTISTNAAYIVDATASAGTVTITDNDLAVVSVTVLDDTLNEAGRGTGTVLLTRTGNLSAPLKVYYGIQGRALHGTDFVALPGEVTFAAGMASVPVVITPYDDNFGEGDETLVFSLTVFDNAYTLGPNYSGTLTIKDNADAPLVTVTANSAAEPSTNGTFTFTAFGSMAGNITVNYTLSGTATAGSDYTAPSGSVTIPGTGGYTNTASVTIPILNNATPEDTETVILTITPGAAYKIYNEGSAVMRIKDDDAEPVAVSTHSSGLAEPADGGWFYLSRAGSVGDLTVNYTMSGTATNGTDYTLLPGSVVIPDGATGVDIAVDPLDDTLKEGAETVTLTLAAGAGYGSEVASGTLYIQDNDLPSSLPSMGFASATGSTSELPDPTTGEYRDIAVTLPSAMTGTVTVEYVIGGGSAVADDVDWSYVDAANGNALINRGVLTFAPGVTSQNVRIKVRNDGVVEGTETAILELRNLNVGGSSVRLSTSRNTHTLTITDNTAANPVPRVGFLVSATTRTETDGTEPLLIAALDAPSATAVTVNYAVTGTATAGADYTLANGTLNFAAGEMFRKLPLVILPDGTAEGAETIIVTLSAPVGATLGTILTHTVTLTDDNAPVIAVAASSPEAIEDSSIGLFTVSRIGGASNLAITVNYTLSGTGVSGTDFTALSGSVPLPANVASVSIPVTPVADTTQEPDKTVILTLSTNPNYEIGLSNEATVTILDDDAPPVVTLVAPTTGSVFIPAGVGLMAQVEATRDTPTGTAQMPVTWSQVSGPGTATFESPANRLTGVTFSAGGTYVIRASATHGVTVNADCTVTVSGADPVQSFSATRFGNAPAGTGFTYSAPTGVYSLTTGGTSIPSSGTADQFLFAQQAISGDCTIVARVVSIGTGGSTVSDNRTGVMIRESLTDGGSPHAFVGITKTPATRFISRSTAAAASTNATGTGAFPCWVRLSRSGNSFVGETAPDASGAPGAWTQVGTQTIAMAGSVFIGIAGASGSTSGTSVAAVVVDKVTLLGHGPVSNIGPNVNAGAALAGAGPFTIDASVTDDGQPLPATLSTQWSTRSGPGTVTFGNDGLVDTSAGFSTAGLYTLRLTATDGQVTTYDDTTANFTGSQPPIETWRAAKFGADASNPAVAGNFADPDFDGASNLVEYALALDPHTSSQGQLPTAVMDADSIDLTWRKNKAATDVTIRVQTSANLTTWITEIPVNNVQSDDGQVQVIRSSVPRSGNRQYVRLEVLPP